MRIHAWKWSIVLILAVLTGCTSQPTQQPIRRPLNVGWFLWNGWYPMAIAQELKLFEKHGVRVNPILYKSYTDILPDLGGGKLDGGFSGMYETLKSNIPNLKIVLVTDHSNGAEGLISLPSIHTTRDLIGKKVGYQGALSGSEFLITTYLRKNSVDPKDITMLTLSTENVLDRMPEEIQAGYAWDPFLAQARKRGYNLLFTTADMPGLIVDIVAFHGSVVRERPEDIRKFNNAWFEAVEFWKKHPREATGMIARVTGLKPEEITDEGCRLFSRQDNLSTFRPGTDYSSVYYTARKQVEFFISVGDASAAPKTDQILTPEFLK